MNFSDYDQSGHIPTPDKELMRVAEKLCDGDNTRRIHTATYNLCLAYLERYMAENGSKEYSVKASEDKIVQRREIIKDLIEKKMVENRSSK